MVVAFFKKHVFLDVYRNFLADLWSVQPCSRSGYQHDMGPLKEVTDSRHIGTSLAMSQSSFLIAPSILSADFAN